MGLDPASWALIGGAVLGAGSAVYSAQQAPKYKKPPPPIDKGKAAMSAAEIQKQKALSAYSTLDTFVSGPGLGKPGPKFLKTNSLLGAA